MIGLLGNCLREFGFAPDCPGYGLKFGGHVSKQVMPGSVCNGRSRSTQLPNPMLLFKRILQVATGNKASREKRRTTRYELNPEFPLKAVLSLTGRDNFGNPLKASDNKGWDWKGQLMNFSSTGARIALPPAALAARGDDCQLKLSLDRYLLVVPSRVAHLKEHRDHMVIGLELNLTESQTRQAYRQLVELVALGSSLKLVKHVESDNSGYLVEQYGGKEDALLTVWRDSVQQMVMAFELKVREYYIRGTSKNRKMNYFVADEDKVLKPVATAMNPELQRLFQWIVPNLTAAVPADVQDFLKIHA